MSNLITFYAQKEDSEEWVSGRVSLPYSIENGQETSTYFYAYDEQSWIHCVVITDSICTSLLDKWKYICYHSENVASEVLRCEEAKKELSIAELREILHWTGDDEFVEVTDKGDIVVLKDNNT